MVVGIHLFVSMAYICSIAPPQLAATACTLASALSVGFGGILGNLSGGWMLERWGIPGYIGVATGCKMCIRDRSKIMCMT